MRVRIFTFALALFGCVLLAHTETLDAGLPDAIKATLNKEYPGWRFAAHPPSMIRGDFDGDGEQDYAVQIALTNPGEEEQIVIVFVKRGASYQEQILESRGLDPAVYLRVQPAPRADPRTPSDTDHPAQLIVVVGGPTGDTAYGFRNDAFHEAETTPAEAPTAP